MKSKLIVTLALGLGLTAPTFASSLVCAGERLYSSNVRIDFGIKPPTGAVTGTHTIVFEGKVVLHYNSLAGLHVQGQPPYQVNLFGEKKILEQTGNMIFGSTTFKQSAMLMKVDPMDPSVSEEVGDDEVICKQTWAMVP